MLAAIGIPGSGRAAGATAVVSVHALKSTTAHAIAERGLKRRMDGSDAGEDRI